MPPVRCSCGQPIKFRNYDPEIASTSRLSVRRKASARMALTLYSFQQRARNGFRPLNNCRDSLMALSVRLFVRTCLALTHEGALNQKEMRIKPMTKNKLAFLTVFAAVVLSLPMAHAQTWSTIASSCSPGSDSIGRYAYSN